MTPEQEHQIEECTCVHFAGETGVCKAGVEVDNVRRKSMPIFGKESSLPCIPCINKYDAVCFRYQAPDVEDVRRRRKYAEDLVKLTALIDQDARGLRGIRGNVRCPACGGAVQYGIAGYTGAKRARCETKGCLNFIE